MSTNPHAQQAAATATNATAPRASWLANAVFYQVFPASFSDSNGDGIGDIPGIIERLDYLADLGVNALWLNPCYDSPFRDAGYDVRNYLRVAQRYGNNEDLQNLFHQAQERSMHVILDLVPGHTSSEHPWFVQSSLAQPNEYSQRFIWTDSWISGGDGLPFVGGEADRDGAFITNFFAFQPALNYGFAHPQRSWEKPALGPDALQTCDAMLDVMRFWLSLGASGFRVDMADSLVKRDDDGKPYTIATWQHMFRQIREEFPDAVFVSEWGRPDESFQAGFDMDFYLDWRWDGVPNGYNMLLRNTSTPLEHEGDQSYFNADSGTGIAPFLAEYEPRLAAAEQAGRYFDLITCNHDTARVAPRLSPREIKVAYATMFTMPGVPFLYYGDEIGMRYRELPTKEGAYTRTGSRTPMQWSAAPDAGFSVAAPDQLYLPVDPAADAPNVAEQRRDPESLWTAVHDVIEIRRAHAALAPGAAFRAVFGADDARTFAFVREGGGERIVAAANPSREAETHDLGDAGASGVRTALQAAQWEPLFMIGDAALEGTVLTMGPQSYAAFIQR